MKRVISLLITTIILLSFVAQADNDNHFDLSYVRSNNDIFTVEVDSEEGLAFINSTLSLQTRAYHHKYESDYYNSTQFDVLVKNYFESVPYPVYRLWIPYVGTKHIYAIEVAISFGGKEYVFSNVLSKEKAYELEGGEAVEELLIIFGNDNIEFLSDLYNHYDKIREVENWIDKEIPEELKITMELRGTEIVTSELGHGFIVDFYYEFLAMMHSGGESDWMENVNNSTPMKVNIL